MDTPIPDSYWVVDGLLLAGEYPGSYFASEARARLSAFLDAGIRAFFDLTQPRELPPYEPVLREIAAERRIDVTYERVPIRDADVPAEAELDGLLRRLAACVAARVPTYVHCHGGIGRTGTVVGCWLVGGEGLDADAALARIAELRRATPDARMRSPETDAQVALIRRWASRAMNA